MEKSGGRLVSLRYSQKIGVAVFAGDQRWAPAGALEESMDDEFALSYEIPQITMDSSGTTRLFLRRWVPHGSGSMNERPGAWNVHSMSYIGDRWSAPELLESSAGSNDQRVATAIDADGNTWIAYPADDRRRPGAAEGR